MIPAMAVAEEYARRLAVREAEVARLAKVHERIGNGRVALGVAVLVVAWAVLFERALAPVWLLVPVAAFIALVGTLMVIPTIPVAGMALILGIDRFMSMLRAAINMVGNGVATVVVARKPAN